MRLPAPHNPVAHVSANSNAARDRVTAQWLQACCAKPILHFLLYLLVMSAVTQLIGGLPARALEPTTPLASYGRQAWGMENGLPQNTVQALAQTSDGFIWLGTEVGLVRFDGVSFQLFDKNTQPALPGNDVRCLLATADGSLWIGMWIGTNGGLARWVGGRVQRLAVTDPLASASVLSLMEDREGNIWAGTEADGLHILRDQRFRTIGAREGLTSDATTTVVEGAAGKLWVGTGGGGLNALPPIGASGTGDRAYSVRDVLLSDVILSLAAAPNGDLWVGTPDGLNRIRGGAVDSFTSADGLPDDFIRSLLVDGDGSLWIGTRRGLTHWTSPGASSRGCRVAGDRQDGTFTHANGLGSDLVGAMVRDGKGDLWVATLCGPVAAAERKDHHFTTANGLLLQRDHGAAGRNDGFAG
jgi:ligand-binding sensor domain-containing protein